MLRRNRDLDLSGTTPNSASNGPRRARLCCHAGQLSSAARKFLARRGMSAKVVALPAVSAYHLLAIIGKIAMLMETANATHVANWGLNSLYAVTFRGVPAAEDVSVAHERW